MERLVLGSDANPSRRHHQHWAHHPHWKTFSKKAHQLYHYGPYSVESHYSSIRNRLHRPYTLTTLDLSHLTTETHTRAIRELPERRSVERTPTTEKLTPGTGKARVRRGRGGGGEERRRRSWGCGNRKRRHFGWLEFGHVLIAASLFCGRFGGPQGLVSWQIRGSSIGTRISGHREAGSRCQNRRSCRRMGSWLSQPLPLPLLMMMMIR
ncbi:hypothetical protein LguiB_015903 [Lonicera macranthoides]